MRTLFAVALLAAAVAAGAARADDDCGEVIALSTHDGTTTRYALARPSDAGAAPIALILLPGGGGWVNLDAQGCAQMLKGNSLVRSAPIFRRLGFITAVVDAPSDHASDDGLAGFRVSPVHADDLGRIVTDLRARTDGVVWVVGTSRGSISAVNAASRLTGPAAPDGLALTSALMSGQSGAKKPWVSQTVFDLPLDNIRLPVLVIGHRADSCARSPADLMDRVLARTRGVRQQMVTVDGGPGTPKSGIDACEGKSPHGYVDQEAEVAEGIARFVRGGAY